MGLRSHKSVETDKVFTALNALTAIRAVGGIALGVGMARYNLDPAMVAASAGTLAATDMEGSLITVTKRAPKLQRALRIIPSSLGRIFDPIADKIFAVSIFAAGIANDSIPLSHGGPILATELATATVTGIAKLRGQEPEVSKVGKIGLTARFGTIGLDLSAAALEPGDLQETIQMAGHVSAATAVVLGALSCYKLWKQSSVELRSEPNL